MAANIAFIRKLIADDLYDTMFFVSGTVPQKTRSAHSTILEVPHIKVEIINGRKVYLNGRSYRYAGEIKKDIQREYAV
jgi:hypothetical protein